MGTKEQATHKKDSIYESSKGSRKFHLIRSFFPLSTGEISASSVTALLGRNPFLSTREWLLDFINGYMVTTWLSPGVNKTGSGKSLALCALSPYRHTGYWRVTLDIGHGNELALTGIARLKKQCQRDFSILGKRIKLIHASHIEYFIHHIIIISKGKTVEFNKLLPDVSFNKSASPSSKYMSGTGTTK